MNPMGGINVARVWTAPPTPPARRVVNHSGLPMAPSSSPKPSTKMVPAKISKKSMNAPPKLMVTMNTRYMAARKMGIPITRLSTTLSILSVRDLPTRPPFFTVSRVNSLIRL